MVLPLDGAWLLVAQPRRLRPGDLCLRTDLQGARRGRSGARRGVQGAAWTWGQRLELYTAGEKMGAQQRVGDQAREEVGAAWRWCRGLVLLVMVVGQIKGERGPASCGLVMEVSHLGVLRLEGEREKNRERAAVASGLLRTRRGEDAAAVGEEIIKEIWLWLGLE